LGASFIYEMIVYIEIIENRLIKDLHTGTKSCVRVGGRLTGSFLTSSGVRRGCVLAPALFSIAIDWIMSMCADKAGVNVGQSQFRHRLRR